MKNYPFVLRAFRIVSLLAYFTIYADDATAGYCLESWACWEVREHDGATEFWIVNKKPYVITATLDVKTRNFRSDTEQGNRYTRTGVIAGLSERRVLRLTPVKPGKPTRYRDVFYWLPGDMFANHDSDYPYLLPYAPDEHYRIVQGFGGRYSHQGPSKYAVDIAMPVGTPVHAARAGTVVQVQEQHHKGGASRRYARYANYIIVLHSDGTTGEYHHLQQNGSLVEVGEEVKAGQHIGYSGNTGFSSLPHLHFAVYRPGPSGEFESLPFVFERR